MNTTARALTRILATSSRNLPGMSFRAAGSFLNVDINRKSINMASDCHQGDGTEPLDPIELKKSDVPNPDLNYLEELIREHNVSSLVISWPVQESEKVKSVSGRILDTLDSTLRESGDVMTMSCPFYMLDGGGSRMGSMCLIRASPENQSLDDTTPEMYSGAQAYHPAAQNYMPAGTWLKDYSSLRNLQCI
jgi:RNase H-fold protein (predicted Holliday junction resolvase)